MKKKTTGLPLERRSSGHHRCGKGRCGPADAPVVHMLRREQLSVRLPAVQNGQWEPLLWRVPSEAGYCKNV